MRPAAALIAGALFLSIATATYDAHAGGYPERSIKLIVPTTAGSVPDVLARLVGERLAASMGQPVVIENRPGAIGTIGLNAVAKAPPDGYTLGIVTTTYLAAPSLIPQMPYDTERELSPVAVVDLGLSEPEHPVDTAGVFGVATCVRGQGEARCLEVFVGRATQRPVIWG